MRWIALALILSGCASNTLVQQPSPSKTSEKPADSSPPSGPAIPPFSCLQGKWCEAWAIIVQEKLTTSHLTASLSGLCKGKVEPRRFWGVLVKSIVFAESGYKPDAVYVEKFKDGLTGELARSVGLLQLSVGDKLNYKGDCQGLTNENLKDPLKNLSCGVEIMGNLIGSRGDLQFSLGRYWSTIRKDGRALERLYLELPECM